MHWIDCAESVGCCLCAKTAVETLPAELSGFCCAQHDPSRIDVACALLALWLWQSGNVAMWWFCQPGGNVAMLQYSGGGNLAMWQSVVVAICWYATGNTACAQLDPSSAKRAQGHDSGTASIDRLV